MKSIILRGYEARQLARTGSVQVVRRIVPQPVVTPSSVPGMEDCFSYGWRRRFGGWDYFERDCSPFGQVGEAVAIKETWGEAHPAQIAAGRYSQPGRAGIPGPPRVRYGVVYRADGEVSPVYPIRPHPFRSIEKPPDREVPEPDKFCWVSPTLMPQWAVRHRPFINGLEVIRVQSITEKEALRTGVAIDHENAFHVAGYEGRFAHRTAAGCLETWIGLNEGVDNSWKRNEWCWSVYLVLNAGGAA